MPRGNDTRTLHARRTAVKLLNGCSCMTETVQARSVPTPRHCHSHTAGDIPEALQTSHTHTHTHTHTQGRGSEFGPRLSESYLSTIVLETSVSCQCFMSLSARRSCPIFYLFNVKNAVCPWRWHWNLGYWPPQVTANGTTHIRLPIGVRVPAALVGPAPLLGSSSEYCRNVWCRIMGLTNGERSLRNVTIQCNHCFLPCYDEYRWRYNTPTWQTDRRTLCTESHHDYDY